ncbi:unnamed protein product [Ambrosiozyma monospora]|uniref:Unnamed protein product n=1 Tax=Ambrosiozyma monospora TaxID=43982 RepID=A0A9W6YPB8_AMBMO|nr:unnamed protein product [Ambrosiozyma monospora]
MSFNFDSKNHSIIKTSRHVDFNIPIATYGECLSKKNNGSNGKVSVDVEFMSETDSGMKSLNPLTEKYNHSTELFQKSEIERVLRLWW